MVIQKLLSQDPKTPIACQFISQMSNYFQSSKNSELSEL